MNKIQKADRISELQTDIYKLEQMKVLYEQTSLTGTYYSDMMREINLQINDCNQFIKKLETQINRL